VLIAAVAENGVIGRDGALPWRLSEDLKQFKRRTLDKPILMGRKTWESLPGVLKRRAHLVLSRDPDYAAEGAETFTSLEDALRWVEANSGAEELCVIGGAAIYALTLPIADELLLTHVEAQVEGDTILPTIDWAAWRGEVLLRHEADDRHDHAFRVVSYTPAGAQRPSS